MIRTERPIGKWTVQLRGNSEPQAAVEKCVQLMMHIASILDELQLLRPDTMIVDGWINARSGRFADFPDYEATLAGPADIKPVVGALPKYEVIPATVLVRGSTAVKSSSGYVWVRRALELRADSSVLCAVEIATYIDVWLPYDLRGSPQEEVYSMNAPRLTEALRAVRLIPNTQVESDEVTPYAVVGRVSLMNHTDSAGRVVPVWFEPD